MTICLLCGIETAAIFILVWAVPLCFGGDTRITTLIFALKTSFSGNEFPVRTPHTSSYQFEFKVQLLKISTSVSVIHVVLQVYSDYIHIIQICV